MPPIWPPHGIGPPNPCRSSSRRSQRQPASPESGRAVQPIARVAQTGNDVGNVVEVVVDRSNYEFVGQAAPIERGDAFRGRQHTHADQSAWVAVPQDAAGMGACKMMRRVIGLAGVEDIRGIENMDDRSIAASLALNIAQALIMNRRSFNTIEEIVEAAVACKPTYPWKS